MGLPVSFARASALAVTFPKPPSETGPHNRNIELRAAEFHAKTGIASPLIFLIIFSASNKKGCPTINQFATGDSILCTNIQYNHVRSSDRLVYTSRGARDWFLIIYRWIYSGQALNIYLKKLHNLRGIRSSQMQKSIVIIE